MEADVLSVTTEPICLQGNTRDEEAIKKRKQLCETAANIVKDHIFLRYRCGTKPIDVRFGFIPYDLYSRNVIVEIDYDNYNPVSRLAHYDRGSGVINVEFNNDYVTTRSTFNGQRSGKPVKKDKCTIVKLEDYEDTFVSHFWLMRFGSRNVLFVSTEDKDGSIASPRAYCVDDSITLETIFSGSVPFPVSLDRLHEYCGIDSDKVDTSCPVMKKSFPSS